MKAVRLIAVKKLELVELPKPEPKEGEVRLKIRAVGICGSDTHAYLGSHPFVHPPIVLGHEIAAVVDKVGTGVHNVAVGDQVTVEPNIVCENCYNCRTGRYNICENLNVIGCVGFDGGQSEFIVVPSGKVVKVPQEWLVEQTVMVEPIAVGVHAVRQSGLKRGQTALVIGAGTIGLAVLQALKAMLGCKVVVSDLSDVRLKMASSMGADFTLNPSKQDLATAMKSAFGVDGADVIIDCVGIQSTLETAVNIARKGIRILMVGVPAGELRVNMALVQDRELEIVGALMYRMEDFEDVIRFIENGEINVIPFVTHSYPLEKVEEAFDMAINHPDETIKVILAL